MGSFQIDAAVTFPDSAVTRRDVGTPLYGLPTHLRN